MGYVWVGSLLFGCACFSWGVIILTLCMVVSDHHLSVVNADEGNGHHSRLKINLDLDLDLLD